MDILLVEDDPTTGEAILGMLEALGHGVTWARDGHEALACVAQDPALSVILTDILMPGMDGLEAIQALRTRGFLGRIIAMTAQHDMPYLRAARLLGATGVLHKPFRLADLARVLGEGGSTGEGR